MKGPNLEPGLQTPVEVGQLLERAAPSPRRCCSAIAIVAAGYDERVHLYSITVRAGAGR